MMSFRSERLRGFALPTSTVWLLTDIAEAKGRQDLYAQQAPQVLRALRETAIIQSAESSNRIEGVTVAPERLRPLILGSARPRDHSEQEVQGYRDALNQIHTRAAELPLTPASLLSLHETIQHGAADAGKWKQVDNDIVELRPNAPPRLRFKTRGRALHRLWTRAGARIAAPIAGAGRVHLRFSLHSSLSRR